MDRAGGGTPARLAARMKQSPMIPLCLHWLLEDYLFPH